MEKSGFSKYKTQKACFCALNKKTLHMSKVTFDNRRCLATPVY